MRNLCLLTMTLLSILALEGCAVNNVENGDGKYTSAALENAFAGKKSNPIVP